MNERLDSTYSMTSSQNAAKVGLLLREAKQAMKNGAKNDKDWSEGKSMFWGKTLNNNAKSEFFVQENGTYDDGEEEEEKAEELNSDMPLESFLSRAGPALKIPDMNSDPNLALLKKQQQELRAIESGTKSIGSIKTKPSSKPKVRSRINKKGHGNNASIDPDLLRQAFNYDGKPKYTVNVASMTTSSSLPPVQKANPRDTLVATKLRMLSSQDMQTLLLGSSNNHVRPGSSSSSIRSLSSKKSDKRKPAVKNKKLRKASAKYGSGRSLKKKPSTKKLPNFETRTNRVESSQSGDKNEQAKEMEELLENFRSGATLKSLKKQLESSQKSLQNSQMFIQKAGTSWFNQAY